MERAESLMSSPPRVIQGITLKFPSKLWRIINRCDTGAISWNSSGSAVVIRREPFEDEFLSVNGYFKTTNFASFVRQLNIYGFRKLVTRQMWYERDSIFEYYHPCFQRCHPELLPHVVRKAKKGTATGSVENQEMVVSNKLNKVIFLQDPRRTTFPSLEEERVTSYDPDHPLLTAQSQGRHSSEKPRGRPRPSGDMGLMSPRRLRQQVSGVVPSIDACDRDNSENFPDLLDQTETLYVEIEKHRMRKDYLLPSIPQSQNKKPLPAFSSMTSNKNFPENNLMKSPDIVVLSQSSSDSSSSKSMEMMFSSILQDDREPDYITGTLQDSFEITVDPISSPEDDLSPVICISPEISVSPTINITSDNTSHKTKVDVSPGADDYQKSTSSEIAKTTTWMPTSSGDLGSYPFPMGDTLLEYKEDDMGVFTPAYYNPSTGIMTLLLPDAAGDN